MEFVTTSGVDVPALGFGTARMDTYDERRRAMDVALKAGYRHIDTAQVYGSEDAVGDAVAAADLDRDDVFITTKLAGGNRGYDDVIESTHASLDALDTSYIDLLLIHSPRQDVPHEETLGAMNELRDEGLVRHVGVSNFSVSQLSDAMEASQAPILTNQVKYHVRHRQDDLLTFCIEAGVMLTAYSPLGVGDLVEDDQLATLGEPYGKTAGQVALRWLLQQPMVSTIPMSSTPAHIRENFEVFDFELTDEEMREVFDVGGDSDDDLVVLLGL